MNGRFSGESSINLILRRSTVVSAPVQQSELTISPWSLEIKLRQFRVEAPIGLNPFHLFDPFLPWAVAQSPALSEANAKLGSSSVCLRTTYIGEKVIDLSSRTK